MPKDHEAASARSDAGAATTALLSDLVRIDSVNPALVAGAAGETAIARYVADWAERLGLEVAWLEPQAGRPSVLVTARGHGGGRSLMLNAHMDTVGVDGMDAPFEARVESGRLYGRGALDMKSGLAACMSALAGVAAAGLAGDVVLAAVADEEHASTGTAAALDAIRTDAAIVAEPTGLELHLAHRGFAVYQLETRGVASHTSQPERGVNAVAHMGRVLVQIERLQEELAARPAHPLAGHGSAQAVRVQGGEELFVTPAACRLSYERRTLPGEDAATAEAELAGVLERAGNGAAGFDARVSLDLLREPFAVAADEAIVTLTRAHAARVLGRDPVVAGAPYWSDAALLQAAGIPTLLLGAAGQGLHAADEYVELASVTALREILSSVAVAFCA
jgi:acetylornithine deacetylase